MKASFSRVPRDHARFFQQEVGDFPAIWFTAGAELNLEVFALPEETCGVKQCLNTHILKTPAAHCLVYSDLKKKKSHSHAEQGCDEIPSSTEARELSETLFIL